MAEEGLNLFSLTTLIMANKIKCIQFLRDIGSHFTINKILLS